MSTKELEKIERLRKKQAEVTAKLQAEEARPFGFSLEFLIQLIVGK